MDAPFGRVTEEQQARYGVQAYARAQNEWPWMGPMMDWFFKRADEHEKDQPMYYFRMVDPNFTAQPVYAAMKDYIAQARFVPIGFHSTDHWAMDWHGQWQTAADAQAYFGDYKSGRPGDSLSFTFSGTDVDLVALQNPYGGTVQFTIDGQSPREIDLWRTDSGAGGRIPLARDLDDGEHRLTLTVTRAPASINGFVVQRGNTWWLRRAALAAVLIGLAVGTLLTVRRRGAPFSNQAPSDARMNAEK
jgi:hypothetical protein